MRALLVGGLLLAACPKRAEVDWSSVPTLPSPTASHYVRVRGVPEDPVVASLVEGLSWDESLSGAAAGLALSISRGELDISNTSVREASLTAGYAYPIELARGWTADPKQPPPPSLREWLGSRSPEEDLGLVRARSWQVDAWVALVANPQVDLGRQPRLVEVGHTLTFPALALGRLELCSPSGQYHEVDLTRGGSAFLDEAGEWLLDVDRVEDGLRWSVATMVVYAGMSAPEEPLVTPPRRTSHDPTGLARLLLEDIHHAFELDPWRWNDTLDQVALAALQDPNLAMEAEAERRGFLLNGATARRCASSSVEDCISSWAYDPWTRAAILGSEGRSAGLAARELPDDQVELMVLVPG